MANADPTRNYYADLNVPATATENEIRKAFRTLALQYHPDRNPGREAEFKTKFQEIQAAHEVLSDIQQRTKYDADRRRYRGINLSTHTPNTPRTRPPPPSRNAYTTNAPRGGSYYRAAPPKPKPQPERPPTPKRPAGPQHHSTYTSGADRFTSGTFRTPPTAKHPEPKDARAKEAEERANVFTAWQKMKGPRGEERTYDPAAPNRRRSSSSNEQDQQYNPNGAPFGRSQSTRVPPSKKGFDPAAAGGDERQAQSTYRNFSRAAPTPPSAATTPPHGTLPAPSSRDADGDEVPYFEGHRIRTPYHSSAAGERTSMFEGAGRASSVRNSPSSSHRPSPSADADSYSDSGRRKERHSYGGKTKQHPFTQMYSDTSDSEQEAYRANSKNKSAPQNKYTSHPPMGSHGNFGSTQQNKQSNGTTGNVPNSFKSRSEESINMKFSPSDWHGKFEASAGYFTPDMSKSSNARGRASPTRGRPSQRYPLNPSGNTVPPPVPPFPGTQGQQQTFPIPPPPPGPPPGKNFPRPGDSGPDSVKFNRDTWNTHFKDASWAYPTANVKETSPKRGNDQKQRQKNGRNASSAQGAGAKTQPTANEAQAKYQPTATEINGDGDAMDIDSGTPPITTPNTKAKSQPTPPKSRPNSTLPNGTNIPPPPKMPPPTGLNGINNLGFVEPLLPTQNGGLSGLTNLRDTLPFPSASSSSHPAKSTNPPKLKVPPIPGAPLPPQKLDAHSVDTYLSHMDIYVSHYSAYSRAMAAHFASRTAELDADLAPGFVRARGEPSGNAAAGGKGKKVGFQGYLRRMKEDEAVMESWRVAQEQHVRALATCEEVRNKGMRLFERGS